MAYSVGIDQSLNATGIIALKNTKQNNNYYAEVIKPKKVTGITRLDFVERRVARVIKNTAAVKIDVIVLEGYAYAGSKVPFMLGELGGVLKLMFYRQFTNIPIVIVPPSTLKKFVTGFGNAKKPQMIAAVKKKWGQEFKDHNIADAYALAQIGLIVIKDNSKKTAAEIEFMQKIEIIQNG